MTAGPTRPFVFGCSTAVFPPAEVAELSECGPRLASLAAGTVRPPTPAEKHFLLVDRGGADPQTAAERAWVRLKGRRKFEREASAAGPPPDPDYGMVESDADRCWW